MGPRFVNPHSLGQSTIPASRAGIYSSEQEHSASDEERTVEIDPTKRKLAQLDELIKSSLGDVAQPYEPTRKRRKIDHKKHDDVLADDEAVCSIPFRLVSKSLPPKPLVLRVPSPERLKVSNPRADEDNESEAEVRRQRSEAVAIDFEWIILESMRPAAPPPNRDRKVTTVHAALSEPSPPLMITERTRPRPWPPTLRTMPGPPPPTMSFRPNERQIDCPIATIDTKESRPTLQDQRRKRRRRTSPSERPEPAFWRPKVEWGGKSLGYAMGYEGSWPVSVSEKINRLKYTRDTMRKAIRLELPIAGTGWRRR